MNSTLKNGLMFVGIGVALVLVYIFVIKKDKPEENLVSSTGAPIISNVNLNSVVDNDINLELSQDTLEILSSINNIVLEDSIFSSIAFKSLRDGTILLIPDGNEGRVNPFAPIGSDDILPPNDDLNSLQSAYLDLNDDILSSPVLTSSPTTLNNLSN